MFARSTFSSLTTFMVCLLAWTGLALAQDCLPEFEPNDTAAEANALSDLTCAVGDLASGDQDTFAWTVSEEASQLLWQLELESIPGQLTVADIFRVTFADNGVDVTTADRLLGFRTPDGRLTTSDPFLIAPGTYILGTSASGGEGQYVVRLSPVEELRRGRRQGDRVETIEGDLALFGALQEDRLWRWSVSAEDAQRRWQLELLGPIGGALELELTGPDGARVVRGRSNGERLVLPSLGLAEGEYTLTLSGGSSGAPYTLAALSQGLITDGGEVEPNDNWVQANFATFERPLLGGGTDPDYYLFDVTAELAGRPFDLVVASDDSLDIILYDGERNELQRRRGSEGALRDLVLAAGGYGLTVRAAGERYEVRLEAGGAPPGEGLEVEPNDTLLGATSLTSELTARGELDPQDLDVYRFSTEGGPQLWRLQVLGQGHLEITVYNGGGIQQQSLSGERRVRLDNVVLLPGDHFVQIKGDEGEYALRALALGPAPEPPPPDPEAETVPLETAPAPPEQDEAASAPTGPPPPPGLLEREPNDDDSRAELLEAGVTRVGVITGNRDTDVYRFFLANDQYVRIEAVPAEDGDLFFDLNLAGRAQPQGVGQPAIMERWLLAGDYFLQLRSGEISQGFYQLRLSLLDPLALPDDVEPNDDVESANPLPPDLVVEGHVGRLGRRDFFVLPQFAGETELSVEVETDDDEGDIRLTLFRNDGSTFAQRESTYTATLPPGPPNFVRVAGNGSYRLTFAFGAPVDAAALAQANDPAEATLAFAEERAAVTAYWHRGQRFETELLLENRSGTTRSYALEVASSHATVLPELPESITLEPGERATLPVTVNLPFDIRDDQPIRLTVAARDGIGVVTATLTLEPTCEAPPVNSGLQWALPEAMLGGLNVSWSGFGSTAISDYPRNVQLFDGLTSPASGGFGNLDEVVTVELPGDEPILLAGTLLHPQAATSVDRQLFDFELLVSLDGEAFMPVLSGELMSARFEQAFVFDRPVPARFARLRFGRNLDGGEGSWLGEWKLVAAEDAPLGEINLADPALGGSVVWSDPLVQSSNQVQPILTEEDDGRRIDARFLEEATWVIGFHHNRAAEIARLEWLEQVDSPPEDRFERVVVEASLTSPVGPWREVAAWTLERDAAGVATYGFETPLWARYLRFTAPKGAEADTFYPPETLRVIERPAADGYRSALGEWGHYRRDAVFELLNDGSGQPAQAESDANDSRESAQAIASGGAVEGSVQIVEDLDWFRLDLPAGENLLEILLEGDPTINYRYQLLDAAGKPLVFDLEEDGDRLILRYFGEPGTYFLRLEEPKRSVIFSWDTSGSVGPYTPITYNSLARFARDLDPEREFVQLLAFDDPEPTWLLPYWSADPQRVQEAINSYDRDAASSDAENALFTASRALEEREGTRAVLFMTDAESGGYGLTPELWRSLERSRARVFTFEISTSGSDYSQDLMQSWANVDAGHYDAARNVGDFDVGFARASCHLRRPKRYRVELTTAFREPPGPGALRILRGEGGVLPAVEVIFDASGSMGKLLPSGVSRIDAAKGVLTDFVANVLPDGTGFALRAYGHIAPSSCETRLDVSLGPLDRGAALAAIAAIEPKLLSQTPIADSLLAVAGDLADASGPTTVVLLTDGLESCDGDPQAAVEQLRADGIALQLAIISLGLEDPEDVAVFEALATAVGATYVDVQDLDTLEASISAALRPPFEVLDAAGEVVARGTVEGEPISLPAGVYTVRVLTNPVELLREVRVPAETTISLMLGER